MSMANLPDIVGFSGALFGVFAVICGVWTVKGIEDSGDSPMPFAALVGTVVCLAMSGACWYFAGRLAGG